MASGPPPRRAAKLHRRGRLLSIYARRDGKAARAAATVVKLSRDVADYLDEYGEDYPRDPVVLDLRRLGDWLLSVGAAIERQGERLDEAAKEDAR